MLSINITDTRISMICGGAKGKNIIVEKTLTGELSQGCIDNGIIKDIRTLAGEITELLVSENISEKEVVVMVNSGLILFKEMLLPRPKKSNEAELLERMIRNDMGLANDYNFTYSVIKEEKANKVNMLRILAVACPQRLVDGYRELFLQLGLKLKSIVNGNTCAVKLFSNMSDYSAKMPLVAIEIENDFINFNLFEDGKLSLSRYVKLERADNQSAEYLNQTVFDNLFRIVQLFGQGSGRLPIKEITYYGFAPDETSLEQTISQFNIPVRKLQKPDEIVIKTEAEFAEYAPLIGSLYPVNKANENTNLLYSFKYRDKVANIKFICFSVFILCACAGAVFTGYIYFDFHLTQRNMVLDSYEVEYTMLRPAELAEEKTELMNAIVKYNTYSEKVELARELFLFQPKMLPDIVTKLRKELLPGMQINGNVVVSSYDITATFVCIKDDQPARYTEALEKAGYFESIIFNGYQKDEDARFSFTLKMRIKGGNKYEVQ